MASTIITFSGRRCTKFARTQFFTTEVLTSAATSAPSQSELEQLSTTPILQSGADALSTASPSSPSQTLDPTTATTVTSEIAGGYPITTTLPAANSSTINPFSTQTPATPTGDVESKKIIPAAIGGSLGAVAIIALFLLYIFLRRRKRRSVQLPTSPDTGEKTGGYGRSIKTSQFATGLTIPLQKMSTAISSSVAATTMFIGAAFSRLIDRMGAMPGLTGQSPNGTEPAENRISSPPRFPNQEIRHMPSTPIMSPRLNPFSDLLTNPDFDFPVRDPVRHSVSDGSISEYSRSDDSSNAISTSGSRVVSRQANSSQWRLDRAISTHSDPFDLERPPTIHSTIPTPKADQRFRTGYFPDATPKLP
ncbi:hypothetical protein BGW36DRAFT_179095 [Talaromyces proteolyticus]|uniref:Uncharacterized protein n=1 Tax=Talaromyces proteolyticus TaxID=1131652 RepID=A0AAD4KP33_9EURO|nr:uncharacterized protein BGW36DRAFT_179095 [Talaromyces proteolyticus]KAH8695958.1 hypothetical protein BGW36DRAFT_179095 [Talaromyces proteolyticus]